MVAAQPRDQALETPARDDRELGGGAASAMLVEHRDEAVRLAPKTVVNLQPESSTGRTDPAPCRARMPFELCANLAGPREGLFGSGVQAGIVLERRMFVAGFSEGRRLALGSRRRSGGSLVGGAGCVAEKSKGGAICAADAIRPCPRTY